MVHWGLVISTIILGLGLLVGFIGVWGAKGTVMWMMRVTFLSCPLRYFLIDRGSPQGCHSNQGR
jgi:hypothetical protein